MQLGDVNWRSGVALDNGSPPNSNCQCRHYAEEHKAQTAKQNSSLAGHGERPCSVRPLFPVPWPYLSRAFFRNMAFLSSTPAKLSLPNFSAKARATSNATTFSTITEAAGTAHTSLRS